MNRQTTFCLLLLLVVGTISANWMAPVIEAAPPAQAPTPTIDAGLKAQADKLKDEGNALAENNELEGALEKYNEALELYRRAADAEGEARALYNIGLVYYYLENYPEALNYLEQALPLSPGVNLKELPLEAYILIHMGVVYEALGDQEKALEQFEQALPLLQAADDRAEEAAILSQIGTLYQSLGDYQRAIDYHKQALSLWREPEDRLNIAASLSFIALMHSMLGNQKEVLDYYSQALPLWQALNDPVREANTLKNMGLSAFALGDAQQALIFYEQARTIWQNQNDKVNEADMLEIIGQFYLTLGDYKKALDYYKNALQLWQTLGERAREATALTNIGFTHNLLDEQEEALNSYKQALELWEELGNYREEKASTHKNIAFIYKWSGDEQLAVKEYQEALSLWQELDDKFHQSNTLVELALIYVLLGQQPKVRDHLQQAIQLSEAVEEEQAKAVLLSRIGIVYELLGEYESAHRYYHQALVLHRERGQRTDEADILFNIGQSYESQGQLQQALDSYLEAISVRESIRAFATVEELKTALAEQSVDVYQQTILLLMRLGQPAQAFNYVQRAKARTFLDQMANVRIDPKATDDPELLRREQELLGEIRGLEDVLFGRRDFATLPLDGTTRDTPPPLTGEQHQEVLERLKAAYDEYEQLLIDIKLTNPQYASLRSVQASTLITVQQTLPPETTLLEYYVGPTQTLAFVVTPDEFHSVPISITAEALKSAVEGWRSYPTLDDSVPPPSFELHDLLVAPVREHIQTDALVIAPHNVLHYLPFGALHDGEGYLVEDYAITYLPSASVLEYVLLNVHDENGGQLLAFANPDIEGAPPLPGAVAESEAIAALAGTEAIIGSQATETRLISQAPQAARIHLAAHGEFKPSAPQFSRIYLSPDEANDGYLEVHEIFNLDLPNADLVTLSACQTQLGELSAGDELEGLSRAFIYAGTPSLVASLWSVGDKSTHFLMERFYAHLQQGMGKASALRQAQLDTMAHEGYANPYYWAAFTLVGDMGEVESIKDVTDEEPDPPPPPVPSWLLLGGAILTLVLLGGGLWMWNRRR